ncbi:hypothetical protein GDO78_009067 [Eleutherodactylus coqui]|uniref:Uncharacterized protein n=1 Tax=Eleutherodactylus coqui TaxID=57060 RepID=A0A8J6F6M4_ELECQ|nr:hypothetical protein GDO78_009067 [Eleutherodactylus coqui]
MSNKSTPGPWHFGRRVSEHRGSLQSLLQATCSFWNGKRT